MPDCWICTDKTESCCDHNLLNKVLTNIEAFSSAVALQVLSRTQFSHPRTIKTCRITVLREEVAIQTAVPLLEYKIVVESHECFWNLYNKVNWSNERSDLILLLSL